MLELSRKVKNLQIFTHVSTCYVNCDQSGLVKEEIYERGIHNAIQKCNLKSSCDGSNRKISKPYQLQPTKFQASFLIHTHTQRIYAKEYSKKDEEICPFASSGQPLLIPATQSHTLGGSIVLQLQLLSSYLLAQGLLEQ